MKATITASAGITLPPGTLPFVTIPAPPSANHLFATVRGRRVKSADYKFWLKRAVPKLSELRRPELPCMVCVTIDGDVNESRDGDNCIKPIHDALVEAQVIPGDSFRHVRGGWWKRRDRAGVPCVTVWLVPVDSDAEPPGLSGSASTEAR